MSPVAFISPPQYARVIPYLTVQEWKDAPTGVDPSNLVIGGSQLTQDQQLASVILRASSWVNEYCGQILAATVDTEADRLRVNRQGEVFFHPSNWPVLEVTDVQVGADPLNLVEMDLSSIWIERAAVWLPAQSIPLGTTDVGPLSFGVAPYGTPLYARWTYVNGYPVTTLAAQANSGQNQIVVADANHTGIYAGTVMQIYDDVAGGETLTAAATPTTSTVTLTANLATTHAAGLPVTSLPPAVKQAAILLTSALIRTRGNEALVMDTISGAPNKTRGSTGDFDANVTIALGLLDAYRRVR